MDAIACEPQFLDHMAPVWRALPSASRGRFIVDASLAERARMRGIEAEPVEANVLRQSSPPPKADPGDGPVCFAASIGDMKVARRLGYRRFVFIEHGAAQSYSGHKTDLRHSSYSGGPDRDDVGLFLVPNEQAAQRWRESYPAARVEVVGSPRLDDLPRRDLDAGGVGGASEPGPVVAVSFHWPAPLGISGYAGTALGDYLLVLADLAKRYTVIGHAHPKGDWPQRMARQYARAGIEFVPEFDDVCRRADVYVCDNSSTIFEFASTGRPVVLLNARNWHKKQNHGLRFWDAAHVGLQVDPSLDVKLTRDRLFAAIDRALEERPEDVAAREDALSVVYPVRSGATLAVSHILDWLGVRSEVAA